MFEQFNETHRAETYKSVISISVEVLKALTLINGGAAAGMVATLDKLTKVIPPQALQIAMICFLLGLVAAVAAGCTGYFTQFWLHETNMQRPGRVSYTRYRSASVALAILSLTLFAAGALTAAFNLQVTA